MNIKLTATLLLLFYSATGWAQLQFGPGSTAEGQTLDTIVAVVNADVITRKELELAMQDARRQLRSSGAQSPPDEILERQLLERLIMDKLQQSTAQKEGIVVDDPSLNAAVETIARQNNMNLQQLRQTVAREGTEFEDFRKNIRNQIMVNRLRQKVVDSQIQVSEQEVDNAMRQFSASTGGAQEYRIGQILIALPEAASPEQIEAAQAKAEQILSDLRQGGNFRRIAAARSDGREALDGGEIGWRSAAQLPSLFADAVLRLEPGQTTDIIRSPAGFHILTVFDRRGGATDNREAVREALFRRKVEEEWELWLRRLRDEAYVDIRI